MINILIADDEKPIADLLKMGMTKAGYHCICTYDGSSALEEIERQQFDLILLDVMMPKIDGFELMDYIKDLNIPVVFLTAKTSLNDKLKGLHLGAEDYIVKPFEMLEVAARVEGILRRHGKLLDIITIDNLEINTSAMTVSRNGEEIMLTKKEYDLLLMFARNPGIVLYKEAIYEQVWGGDYPESTRTVELHIQRLKKKLDWSDKIKPVYTVGYRLVVN